MVQFLRNCLKSGPKMHKLAINLNPVSGIQMVKSPYFGCYLQSDPVDNRRIFNHLNTGLVWYWAAYCMFVFRWDLPKFVDTLCTQPIASFVNINVTFLLLCASFFNRNYIPPKNSAEIYCWLLRCGTARGSSTGFSQVSPTKVFSILWKFPCIEDKEHLVDFSSHFKPSELISTLQ